MIANSRVPDSVVRTRSISRISYRVPGFRSTRLSRDAASTFSRPLTRSSPKCASRPVSTTRRRQGLGVPIGEILAVADAGIRIAILVELANQPPLCLDQRRARGLTDAGPGSSAFRGTAVTGSDGSG